MFVLKLMETRRNKLTINFTLKDLQEEMFLVQNTHIDTLTHTEKQQKLKQINKTQKKIKQRKKR